MYDCIIIGGGHNGLVTAGYLARAAWKVLVLERRPIVGGACVTEEPWPGYKVSTASYVVSLLLPEIVKDLRLAEFGYRVLPRNPSSFTPLEDGRYLLLGPNREANRREVLKFSARDAEALPRYESLLERIAECLEPVLTSTPPDLLPLPATWRRIGLGKRFRDARQGISLWSALRKLGADLPEAIEILTGAARPILDRWFESDVLKATLATDAIIGTFQPISAPGTAYVLLHHVMGMAGGARGVWGYVQGGMGALTQAMARSVAEFGVEIRCDAAVERMLVENGRVAGVRLASGEEVRSWCVASSADAHVTFERLVEPQHLPDEFRAAVARIDYSSASAKINLAVSELPDFTCCPGNREPGPQHRGTIHIFGRASDSAPNASTDSVGPSGRKPEQTALGGSMDYLERAYDDAKYGRPSQRPIVEMTIPTSVDSTLAPPGQHILSLFVQYAPYKLARHAHASPPTPLPQGARGEVSWDDPGVKDAFADCCIAEIARYAPNVPGSILHRQVLSPLDLERTFSLTGGNIFQGAMPLHQLFSLRPVAGWSDYRTPIAGLYLCGSAAHPGGGVMGACGRNAAVEILRDA